MQRCHDCLVAILGISWALTGLETAAFSGHSWSLVVTRGDTKPLANKGLSPNFLRTPNGIRTRAATLKGWCPRPLDDGGLYCKTTTICGGRAAGI